MLAALALVQHVHGGGISMCLVVANALALVRQMHMCGTLCILQDLHGYGQL